MPIFFNILLILFDNYVQFFLYLVAIPLFLDIYFIYRYRYNMEVDEEKIDTYHISVGVCFWFFRLDVVLKLGCLGAVLM